MQSTNYYENSHSVSSTNPKKITVLGGNQIRPNIHIDDMADVYLHLISKGDSIESGCFNAGFENFFSFIP